MRLFLFSLVLATHQCCLMAYQYRTRSDPMEYPITAHEEAEGDCSFDEDDPPLGRRRSENVLLHAYRRQVPVNKPSNQRRARILSSQSNPIVKAQRDPSQAASKQTKLTPRNAQSNTDNQSVSKLRAKTEEKSAEPPCRSSTNASIDRSSRGNKESKPIGSERSQDPVVRRPCRFKTLPPTGKRKNSSRGTFMKNELERQRSEEQSPQIILEKNPRSIKENSIPIFRGVRRSILDEETKIHNKQNSQKETTTLGQNDNVKMLVVRENTKTFDDVSEENNETRAMEDPNGTKEPEAFTVVLPSKITTNCTVPSDFRAATPFRSAPFMSIRHIFFQLEPWTLWSAIVLFLLRFFGLS